MFDAATLVRRWFEDVWGSRKAAAIDEFLLPDAVVHTEGGDIVGTDAFNPDHS